MLELLPEKIAPDNGSYFNIIFVLPAFVGLIETVTR